MNMKKTYLKPTIQVVTLQQQGIICTSNVSNVDGNADIGYGGGGSGPACVRGRGEVEWDEWQE